MPDLPTFAPRLQRGVASVVDTATQIVLDQRKRLYDAEVQHQYSKGVYEMDSKFNQFMVDAQGRQDYMNLDKDWDQYQKETYSKITADFTLPEAQQAFEKAYLNQEPDRRFKVAQSARTKQIDATLADDKEEIEARVKATDWEGFNRKIESMGAAGGLYSDDDLRQIAKKGHHEMEGNSYVSYGDVLVMGDPTEEGLDEATRWMATTSNTPDWDDAERASKINSFRSIWRMRLTRQTEANQETSVQALLSVRKDHREGKLDEKALYDWAAMSKRYPGLSGTEYKSYIDDIERKQDEQQKTREAQQYEVRIQASKDAIGGGTTTKEMIYAAKFAEQDERFLIGMFETATKTAEQKKQDGEYDRARVLYNDDNLTHEIITGLKSLTPEQRRFWDDRLREKESAEESRAGRVVSSAKTLIDIGNQAEDRRVEWPEYSTVVLKAFNAGLLTDDDFRTWYDRGFKRKLEYSSPAQEARGIVQGVYEDLIQRQDSFSASGRRKRAELYGEMEEKINRVESAYRYGEVEEKNLKDLAYSLVGKRLQGLFSPPVPPEPPPRAPRGTPTDETRLPVSKDGKKYWFDPVTRGLTPRE